MEQQIAAAADDRILIWNSENDEPVATLHHDDDADGVSVNFLRYSPCGSLLVTCAEDIVIWQCDTWTELHRLADHRDRIMCATFNASGELLVTAAFEGKVQLWNVSSGEELLSIQCKPNMMSAIFTVEGDMLVVGEQSDIVFFDCLTGDRLHSYVGHDTEINSLCISPCTNLLISGADRGHVFIWDMISGEIRHRLTGHCDSVFHVSFNSDGSKAVSSSSDYTVHVWDVTEGSCLHVINSHSHLVYSACFAADDRYIISSSLDTTVKIWEIGKKEVIRTLRANDLNVNFAACRPMPQGSYI